MRRVSSQINVDEMVGMDESAMELELIKLQANYRHLSDFYDSYKEESQRKIKTQKSVVSQNRWLFVIVILKLFYDQLVI